MVIHDYAAHGDCDEVRKELRKGVPVNSRDERDYTPLACAVSSPQAGVALLQLLIEAGAAVNCSIDEGKHFPLELAACSGNLSKVQCLLDAGADMTHVLPKGYTVLINIMFALHSHEALVPMIEFLVKHGAEIDCETEYGESPLSVASRLGYFDAIRCLLDSGADPSPLQWSALMKAIALGTSEDVALLLDGDAAIDDEDRFSRSPLHLAALVGDVQKAELLHAQGCQIDQPDRGGDTVLMIAAASGNTDLLRWLIKQGADLEAVNSMDSTALMIAAGVGQTECVRLLLDAGAEPSRRNQFEQSAMSMAATEAVIRLLTKAGLDLTDISTETKRLLIGLPVNGPINASPAEYRSGRDRRFGRSNPEVMKLPFWHEMVRAGVNAYQARMQFGDTNVFRTKPVWCFDRFGMSFTELPNGRFVQIGGEHEDYYDPDFCIYNEVVIHDRSGSFEIMGYPEDVFPPTDFHSATLIKGIVYIIGRLGYQGTREFGTTPVYRLDCRTWKIEPVKTRGDNPGWIFLHKACFDDSTGIVVSGGTICQVVDGEEQHVENEERFHLDLSDMKWTRTSCGNGLGKKFVSDA
jgi:ankyrin repeat protein